MESSDSARAPLLHENSPSREREDISVEIHKGPQLQHKLGVQKALGILYGFQYLHKTAFSSISTNLVVFLTTVLHIGNASSVVKVSTWSGTCSLTPFIGALIADTCWGYYKTVFTFGFVYLLGLVIITVSSVTLSLYPASCEGNTCHPASEYQSFAFFCGLYMVAFGSGGMDSGLTPLCVDQIEENKRTSVFVWMYICVTLGFLTSSTFVVWIQEYVAWSLGFGIATSCLALGFIGFILGKPTYQLRVAGGSPLKSILQVLVASFRKMFLESPTDISLLYEVDNKRSNISGPRRLAHTDQFRFLDKAAVISNSESKFGDPQISWRLCTVTQVEELKVMMGLLPIWTTSIIFVIGLSQSSTTFIEQGSAMETMIWSISIPPASLSAFRTISALGCSLVYKELVTTTKKYFRNGSGLSLLQWMGVGHVLLILTFVTAAFIEFRRLESINRTGIPMNIAWQLPQYFIVACAEVFLTISMSEFFYDQAPDSIKCTASAVTMLAVAFGNYLSSFVVTVVGIITTAGGRPGWIADDLNKGHLDYFFWSLTGLLTLNFAAHIVFSMRYKPKRFIIES